MIVGFLECLDSWLLPSLPQSIALHLSNFLDPLPLRDREGCPRLSEGVDCDERRLAVVVESDQPKQRRVSNPPHATSFGTDWILEAFEFFESYLRILLKLLKKSQAIASLLEFVKCFNGLLRDPHVRAVFVPHKKSIDHMHFTYK